MERICQETQTEGKTATQTLSRTLQEWRDFDHLDFGKRGYYKLNNVKIDYTKFLNKNGQQSKGEKMTKMLLEALNIKFETEKTFPNLRNKNFYALIFILNTTTVAL